MSKLWLYLVFLIVLCSLAWGTGVCELDQYDYTPGELASFSCSCSLPNEENVGGFVIWRNESVVLLNESVNSGDCRVSFFSSQFVFPAGANYSGNVTFETSSVYWDDPTDVVIDVFNVSGAGVIDCLINDFSVTDFVLGEVNSWRVRVIDSLSGDPILHAGCTLIVQNIAGDAFFISSLVGEHVLSNSEGFVVFQHDFDERFWNPETVLKANIACHCLGNDTENPCYNSVSGEILDVKICSVEKDFVLSSVDNRSSEDGFLPLVFVLLGFVCYFGVLGLSGIYFGKVSGLEVDRLPFWIVFVSFGLVLVELVLLAFLAYANEVGAGLFNLLLINFYVMLLLGGGTGMIVLYLTILYIVSLKRGVGEDGDKNFSKEW